MQRLVPILLALPPEEVADRADSLRDRLDAAQPDAASEAPILTIFFPQRDLHLASVSPAAHAALFDTVPGRREASRS